MSDGNRTAGRSADSALVARAQSGDAGALDELVRRHTPTVAGVASAFFSPGFETDDVRQEGMLAFLRAVRSYRHEVAKGSFEGFVRMCVRRWLIYSCARRATQEKHRPLNQSLRVFESEEGELLAAAELLPDPRADIVDLLSHREELRVVGEGIDRLSPRQAHAVRGMVLGLTYEEIGDPDQVDNALWRARRILRRRLRDAA